MAPAMAKEAQRSMRAVLSEARRTLGMTQEQFGLALGSSHRSAVRWDGGDAEPAEHHLRALVPLLYRENRELAAEVASVLHETLESLGLEAPPAPPVPPLAPVPRIW